MIWVAIDVTARMHLKQQRAGAEASWLWACGVCYCQEKLTDGFIAREKLSVLTFIDGDLVAALAARLVEVGLWEAVEGGFRVHDYLDYQQSHETVSTMLSERGKKAAEARWLKRRAVQDAMQQASQAYATDAQASQAYASDAHASQAYATDAHASQASCIAMLNMLEMPTNTSTSTNTSTKDERDTHAAKNGDERKGPDDRHPPKGHRGHAHCGARFCVPHFLHEEFDRQLGGSDVVDLLAWYPKVDARAQQLDVIEDPLAYVRGEFKKALQGRRRHGFMHVGEARAAGIDDGHGGVMTTLESCPHTPHCLSSRACQTLRDIETAKAEMQKEARDGSGSDLSAGGSTQGVAIETGRSYSVRHLPARGVRGA